MEKGVRKPEKSQSGLKHFTGELTALKWDMATKRLMQIENMVLN